MIKKLLFCLVFLCVVCGCENIYASEPSVESTARMLGNYTGHYFSRTVEDGVNKYYVDQVEVSRDEYYAKLLEQKESGFCAYKNTDQALREEDNVIILKMQLSNDGYVWYDTEAEALEVLKHYYTTYPTESLLVAFESTLSNNELRNILGIKMPGNVSFSNIVTYWASVGRISFHVSIRYDSGMNFITVKGGLNDYTETTVAEYQQCIQIADQIAAQTAGMDRYNQIKYVNDYLCNTITYASVNHSLDGALIEKQTVCEGYTLAFKLIMDRLGIPCYIVTSSDHAWNAVELDGKLYWVDTTWADQKTWISYNYFLVGTNVRTNHTDLNISSTSYGTRPSGGQPENPNPQPAPQPQPTPQPTPQPEPVPEDTMIETETEVETEVTQLPDTNTTEIPMTEESEQSSDITASDEVMNSEGENDMNLTPSLLPVFWAVIVIVVIVTAAIVTLLIYRKNKQSNINPNDTEQ